EEPRMPLAQVGLVPQALAPEPRLEPPRKLVGRQPRDVLLVEPVELLWVKHGVAAADPLEREDLLELVYREDLLVRPRRPPEQRQEVDHRLGQIALAPVLADRRRPVPLAQPLPVGAENERHVRKLRQRRAD